MQVPLIGTATYESRDKESQTIPVIAENISEEGAYLTAKHCPDVGDRTEISLRCDAGLKQLKSSLEAVGTVTRVDRTRPEAKRVCRWVPEVFRTWAGLRRFTTDTALKEIRNSKSETLIGICFEFGTSDFGFSSKW